MLLKCVNGAAIDTSGVLYCLTQMLAFQNTVETADDVPLVNLLQHRNNISLASADVPCT